MLVPTDGIYTNFSRFPDYTTLPLLSAKDDQRAQRPPRAFKSLHCLLSKLWYFLWTGD